MEWMFYVHAGGFAAAALAAFGVGLFSPRSFLRSIAWGNAVPLFVSSMTYLLARTLPPETRWLGYTAACGFFAYETALVLGRGGARAAFAGLLMSLTLFAGYAGYVAGGALDTWLVFALGSATYACSMALIAWDERWRLPSGGARQLYLVCFALVWSAYAGFYAFGPAGAGLLSRESEELAYFVLEFPAKYGVAAVNLAMAWSVRNKY